MTARRTAPTDGPEGAVELLWTWANARAEHRAIGPHLFYGPESLALARLEAAVDAWRAHEMKRRGC